MKFEALATTSTGLAHTLGQKDGSVSRDQVLSHCRSIVEATELPVSADLENGYGKRPEDVAETIALAAGTGLVGGSIEDHTNIPSDPIIDLSHAVERIQAAVESIRKLPHDFILTARCENYVWGRNDLDDTIKRLQAFENAGADVLYAPGLQDINTIRQICESVTKPVNVVIEISNTKMTLKDLSDAGVKRISIGSVLFLTAYGSFARAAAELKDFGTFKFVSGAISFSELERIFDDFSNC
jgi:2-methylisocitrate lyase-like PEP mutase family enzyme